MKLFDKLFPKPPAKPPEPDLWAFWHYDQFPFYLSGKVVRIEENGTLVRVEGYQSHRFKFRAIIPGDRGYQLHRYLRAARSVHHDMVQGVEVAMRECIARRLQQDNLPGRHRKSGMMFGSLQTIFDGAVQDVLDGNAPCFMNLKPEDIERSADGKSEEPLR